MNKALSDVSASRFAIANNNGNANNNTPSNSNNGLRPNSTPAEIQMSFPTAGGWVEIESFHNRNK